MNWEFVGQFLTYLIPATGAVLGVIKFAYDRAEKLEQDKLKARQKIKDLEGKLQQVFLDQMKQKIDHLEKQLDDHGLKFEDMAANYNAVSKRIERASVLIDKVSEDVRLLYRQVIDNKPKNFGSIKIIDEGE
jgi:predicted  nucleic acid-binding Zn-ribbon protein